MIERITQSMLASTSIANVQANLARYSQINEQMTSGKRMRFASDDPASSVDSMRLRKQLSQTQQYSRNIDDANGWLQTADTAMLGVYNRYNRIKEQLIYANSSSQGVTSLRAIGAELREQAGALMNYANTQFMGRTVFAGNSDKGGAFILGSDGQYYQTESDAVTAQPVERQINGNQTVQANVDGNKLFGTGSVKWKYRTDEIAPVVDGQPPTDKYVTKMVKVPGSGTAPATYYRQDKTDESDQKFYLVKADGSLDKHTALVKSATGYSTNAVPPVAVNGATAVWARDHYDIDTSNNPNIMNLCVEAAKLLEDSNGNPDESKLLALQKEITRRTDMLKTEQSALGARHKIVLDAQNTINTRINDVKSNISRVEDIDIQKTTIDLSLAQMAYQASLGATTKVMQPTLLDYLR